MRGLERRMNGNAENIIEIRKLRSRLSLATHRERSPKRPKRECRFRAKSLCWSASRFEFDRLPSLIISPRKSRFQSPFGRLAPGSSRANVAHPFQNETLARLTKVSLHGRSTARLPESRFDQFRNGESYLQRPAGCDRARFRFNFFRQATGVRRKWSLGDSNP
jgi:hypothetical protein